MARGGRHASGRRHGLARPLLLLTAVATTAVAATARVQPTLAAPWGAEIAQRSSTKCNDDAYCFIPSRLAMAVGDTVTWTNTSSAAHRIARCTPAACGVSGGSGGDAGQPASPVINPGETFTYTARSPGSYLYYCTVHGYAVMHASLTVTGAASPTPTPQPTPTPTATPSSSPAPTGAPPAVGGGGGPASPAPTPFTGAAGHHAPSPGLLLITAGLVGLAAAPWRRRSARAG